MQPSMKSSQRKSSSTESGVSLGSPDQSDPQPAHAKRVSRINVLTLARRGSRTFGFTFNQTTKLGGESARARNLRHHLLEHRRRPGDDHSGRHERDLRPFLLRYYSVFICRRRKDRLPGPFCATCAATTPSKTLRNKLSRACQPARFGQSTKRGTREQRRGRHAGTRPFPFHRKSITPLIHN